MKKIRGEFLTETEANSAIEKINPYCLKAIIDYSGDLYTDAGYNEYNAYDNYMSDSGLFGIPEMNSFGFGNPGNFGMIANWSLGPYSITDKYNHTFPHSHLGYDPSARTTVEADVPNDNYEYVKDKLYSLGAITVS